MNDDYYRAPRADLRQPVPPHPAEGFLRWALLVVFGLYVFIDAIMVPVGFFLGDFNRALALAANGLANLGVAVLGFLAAKRRQPRVALWGALLFATGFGGTALYRLAFVVPALDFVDFKNALMFGVPAVVAVVYGRMLERTS